MLFLMFSGLFFMFSGIFSISAIRCSQVQFFPNCVQQHTGVLLKRLKCDAKVLCFDKTFCMLHHFHYKVCEE